MIDEIRDPQRQRRQSANATSVPSRDRPTISRSTEPRTRRLPGTAMGEAFHRAGFASPRERIDQMVRDAIEKAGGNTGLAVVELSRALLASEVSVVWEFFAPDRAVRLWKEIETTLALMRHERGLDKPAPKEKGGQGSAAGKAERNPPPPAESGQEASASTDSQRQRAALAPAPPMSSILQIAADSFFRRVTIAGRPIGECSAGLARDWSRARGKESRFAWLLAEGLPDAQIIAEWKTEADAEQAYRLAQEEQN